jgi:hypothetical protein
VFLVFIMVQIRLFTLLSASLALATPLKRDVPTVENDIATISTRVTTLDTAIHNYPSSGGTLAGALVSIAKTVWRLFV